MSEITVQCLTTVSRSSSSREQRHGDLLSASKSSSSAQFVILVSGWRNVFRGTGTPFFLDDMTFSQRCSKRLVR